VNSKNCVDGKLYVLNLDSVDSSGTHWVLLSLVDKDKNLYYDSYSAPSPMSVEKFLKKQRKDALLSPLYYNDQSILSVTCGYFVVLMALLQIKRGFTPEQCINLFQNDVESNEEIIEMFAMDVLKKLKGYSGRRPVNFNQLVPHPIPQVLI
jgi:hypothetical protein